MTKTPADQPGGLACARARVLIESYVDGDLATTDPDLASRMKLHLAGCEDCRRQYHHAVSLPFRLKALRAPVPPPSLLNNVMNAVRPARVHARRAWAVLLPAAPLRRFFEWCLSRLAALASLGRAAHPHCQWVRHRSAGDRRPAGI